MNFDKYRNKKIGIVGAGPGGLTSGMLLASKGFDVTIFEKADRVGGRNASFDLEGFKFDLGPTFLMLKPILDDVFRESGKDVNNYLTFYDLDPMYELVFKDKKVSISRNHDKTYEEIRKYFSGEEQGFIKLLEREKIRFEKAFNCLKKDYSSIWKLFNLDLIRFIPWLSFPKSMYEELGNYFKSDELKISFTFQSKYIGMSPWDCPAAYMIIPYIEHNFGIYHVKGGLSEISEAMKRVFLEYEGKLLLNTKVKKIQNSDVTLENGENIHFDKVIINADVGYAFKELLDYNDLSHKKFSCSTFMLYLGLDKNPNTAHHTIFFSNDYHQFVDSIFHTKKLNYDISLYVRNASVIDPTLAPDGMYNVYILVPTPNNKANINWEKEANAYRYNVIKKFSEKVGFDVEKHIVTEKVITPQDWEQQYNVFLGATFNLAHTLDQMLYFRPHNKLNPYQYLVGGGTNPGSGLPTIYMSGRIASELITKEFTD